MSSSPPSASYRPQRPRLLWLDWFRGLAVIAMIWVHTANSLLSQDIQSTPWFKEMTFWHGLIAPSFFWISGFTRGLLANPARPAGNATLRRLSGLLLLGYALHFPFWAVLAGDWSSPTWQAVWQVDVLHALAITGFILVALERLSAARPLPTFTLIVPLLAFVLPTAPASHWLTGWQPIDAWLNNQHGSLFPLFPWVGFGIAGFLCGRLCTGPAIKERIRQLSGVGILLALLLPRLHWLDSTSAFFLQRLGWVLVFASLMVWPLAPALARLPRVASLIGLAGRESLFLYVIHLLLLFSIPFPQATLTQRFGLSQPLPATILWFLAITLISLALTWLKIRHANYRSARRSTTTSPSDKPQTLERLDPP